MTIAPATVAFRRVYVDLPGEADAKLEALAKSQGRTKKAQLEWLINEAIAEMDAQEKETAKRAKKSK